MNSTLGIIGVSAADSLHRVDPMVRSAGSLWGLLLHLALSLALIGGLIWGSIYLMKRMSGRSRTKNGHRIHVVECRFIAPKKAIYIVQIGGRTMALGVTDAHMTMLTELPDLPLETETPEASNAFSKWMKKI
ncbi:MAG: flagellar biosynthetic protein FliO [Candidatus Latescibacteria bacterium]|nr:flagellar biosynthetic protein FliO [Candidatus Latescibacterota bacterium]MCK5329167.1 flagellar biosynthetic protein FliO [Candidatus Latescibacterota bacterium]MCK5380024.1 flagellar biosynthetic protein FliO [Candidatus Latescibacterota bacterium]MCK5527306.1 flagellar biosynthetic protein FliO [Candidatus Latescibacterota bacterium]